MEPMSSQEIEQVALMTYSNAWISDAVLEAVIAHLPNRDQLIESIRKRIAKARADSALVLLDAEASHLTEHFERSAQRWLNTLDGLTEG